RCTALFRSSHELPVCGQLPVPLLEGVDTVLETIVVVDDIPLLAIGEVIQVIPLGLGLVDPDGMSCVLVPTETAPEGLRADQGGVRHLLEDERPVEGGILAHPVGPVDVPLDLLGIRIVHLGDELLDALLVFPMSWRSHGHPPDLSLSYVIDYTLSGTGGEARYPGRLALPGLRSTKKRLIAILSDRLSLLESFYSERAKGAQNRSEGAAIFRYSPDSRRNVGPP